MAWRQTAQHAATPQDAARNATTFQLCQPAMPKSRVRGVVGVRVFPDAHLIFVFLALTQFGCEARELRWFATSHFLKMYCSMILQ
jgi:hypothetical protein